MTSFGRGRGWASQSQDREQGLRRPGGGGGGGGATAGAGGATAGGGGAAAGGGGGGGGAGGGGAFGSNKVLKDIIDKIVSYDECKSVLPQLIQDIVDLLTIAVNEDSLKYYEFPFGSPATVISARSNAKLQISDTCATLFGSRLYTTR